MPQISSLKKSILKPLMLTQVIGLLCWIASWCLNPFIDRTFDIYIWCVVLANGICILTIYNIKNFVLWRVFGIVYIETLVFLFKIEAERMGVEAAMWGLIITSLLITVMSVFFVKITDYAFAVALAWMIMWHTNLLPISDVQLPLFYVLLVGSTLLGGCLNATFVNLVLKEIRARDKFKKLSETDPLTESPNRRAMVNSLKDSLASKDRTSLWFAMLDLDNFKSINDQHGHDVGDNVLISFAKMIKNTKGIVSYGRLGGEEFGVLLSAVTATDAISSLNDLLLRAKKDDSAQVQYSFSAGITSLASTEIASELLKSADDNLYHAKRSGRNCISFEAMIVANASET
ncbi:GGDEF domain-containing protein [Pseudomonas sp. PB120]|uniref:GGDEF domain-containing protein n=1 Tax=Pseudomonas sp. PB120 TaxID=2494700 RepID=UPI0012FD728E|nr:GGDEF domain-containing protein [Pseudomonas sp. PB120]MVV51726.1 GGDEF domain-containing protein [Pseudomonas sp. PB120]